METLYTILFVVQVVVAVTLVGFVLLQHGKGADAGAAFGSGASSTVFGSQGSAGFLTKTTAVLAVIFLANSLFLAYLVGEIMSGKSNSLMDNTVITTEVHDPAMEEVGIPGYDQQPIDMPAVPE